MAADSYPVFAPMRPGLDYHNSVAANKSNAEFGAAYASSSRKRVNPTRLFLAMQRRQIHVGGLARSDFATTVTSAFFHTQNRPSRARRRPIRVLPAIADLRIDLDLFAVAVDAIPLSNHAPVIMNRTQSFSPGSPGQSAPVHLPSAQAFRRCEQRLDVLCDLIDEELRHGQVGDRELEEFVKKITGEVDLAMSQEDCWFDEGGFIS